MPILVSSSLAGLSGLKSLGDELSEAYAVSSTTEELLLTVKTYCFVGQCNVGGNEYKSKLTIIIDGRDSDLMKGLLYTLRSPQAAHRPRVIMLSSILTWAGANSGKGVTIEGCSERQFWDRVPVTGEYPLYSDENRLVSLMLCEKLSGLEVCIVPQGLVYGGAGGDLENIMDSIWRYNSSNTDENNQTKIIVPSSHGPDLTVPMIHQNNFSKLIAALCTSETIPLYIPAADCSGLGIQESLIKSFESVNGASISVTPNPDNVETQAHKSDANDSIVTFADEETILEAVLNGKQVTPVELVWGSNINFTKKCLGDYATAAGGSLPDSFSKSWSEYLIAKQLNPVSIFISGTPGTGKTELSNSICSALGCQQVDIDSAILHVVKNIFDSETDKMDSSLRSSLITILEAEMEKNQPPPKKGEEPIKPEVIPDTFELNDGLRASIDDSMKRRCLSAYVRQNALCKRRGYVMDIWDSNLVTNHDDLVACTTGAGTIIATTEPVTADDVESATPAPSAPEPDAESSPEGDSQVDTCENIDKQAAGTPSSRNGPELVIEIQAKSEGLVNRLLASLGIADGTLAKAPKDQQATVKALEDKLSGYTATLQEIIYPEPEKIETTVDGDNPVSSESKGDDPEIEQAIVREFTHSHPAIIDIENKISEGISTCQVLRIDATTRSVAEVNCIAAQRLIEVHGSIGWLSSEECAKFITTPTPEVSAESESSINEKTDSTGGDVPIIDEMSVEESKESTTNKVEVLEPIILPNEPGAKRTAARIQQTLSDASGDNKDMLINAACDLQTYLLQHIMPELASGMVQIATDAPVDPITFLADHLDKLGNAKEQEAEVKAKAHFDKLLAMAEGTWVEPEVHDDEGAETEGDTEFPEEETLGESMEATSIAGSME